MLNYFNNLSRERQGELLIFLEAILWGFFPVITKLSFNNLPPIFSAASGLLLSLIFLIAVIIKENKWHELKDSRAFPAIAKTVLFLGIGFYLFVFIGTSYSTPGNVSILLLLEVFSTALIMFLWGKEKLSIMELLGAFLIVSSSMIVLFPGKFELNIGDLLIAVAVFVAPIGNNYNKIARSYIGSVSILFYRNLFTGLIMMIISLVFERLPTVEQLHNSIYLLLVNGIIIFGVSKILWLEGIHRLRLSKAISISCTFPIVTMIASYFMLSTPPTKWQLIALFPAIIGVLLMTKDRRKI